MFRITVATFAVALALVATGLCDEAIAAEPTPERVAFTSVDANRTPVDGFLYRPSTPAAKAPAVVLMHGRAGIYSSLAKGDYSAAMVSMRHKYWARYWSERGYYVLLVDSFSLRGYPAGFAAGTYKDRPTSIDEVVNRPMDAYGGLKFLRGLPGVDGDRIGLMGWSNGASAVLATLADDKPGDMTKLGFRAALAFYPGCGLKKRFDKTGYKPYAPVQVYMGTADEEVSPTLCTRFVERSRGRGGDIEMTLYPDVTHSFDDPGKRRQSVPANAAATADVGARAAAFFEQALAPR